MASLGEALEATRPQDSRVMQVDKLLGAVDAAGRVEIERALHDLTITNAHLARALNQLSLPVKCSQGAIRNWREKHVAG